MSDDRSTLWEAIWRNAEAWGETPRVRSLKESLPRNVPFHGPRRDNTTMPALLQECYLVGGGVLHVLALGSRVPWILRQFPAREADVPPSTYHAWLENAAVVEEAHQVSLAWIRSRLPGYPMLRAPQLARNSPYTTNEFTEHFIWTDHERSRGLQFLDVPLSIPSSLGAHDPARIQRTTRNVLRALRRSAEWQQFEAAAGHLDDRSVRALRQVSRELTQSLRASEVDQHEPNLAHRRAEYRSHTTKAAIERLDGVARTYADAFSAMEALLKLAVSDVFGEILMYGLPPLFQVQNVNFEEEGVVSFDVVDGRAILLECGDLIWVDNAAVTDAMITRAISLSDGPVEGFSVKARAQLLVGTAGAWKR